jgi:hypothetical protein
MPKFLGQLNKYWIGSALAAFFLLKGDWPWAEKRPTATGVLTGLEIKAFVEAALPR